MKPSMSALVIKNHVSEGVEMARRYSLPKVVIDIIRQHHGTSLIRYFYFQASTRRKKRQKKPKTAPQPTSPSIKAIIATMARLPVQRSRYHFPCRQRGSRKPKSQKGDPAKHRRPDRQHHRQRDSRSSARSVTALLSGTRKDPLQLYHEHSQYAAFPHRVSKSGRRQKRPGE